MTSLKKAMAAFSGNEIDLTVRQALKEEQSATHDRLADIGYSLKLLTGLVQRLLSKFEEASGTPRGTPYTFSQASPTQDTAYTGTPVAYDGVLRSLVVSGPGNITVTINDPHELSGTATLAIIGCNGGAVPVQCHYRVPINATLSIQTDAAGGSGLLALTAWIEPIIESNPEYFRMRR